MRNAQKLTPVCILSDDVRLEQNPIDEHEFNMVDRRISRHLDNISLRSVFCYEDSIEGQFYPVAKRESFISLMFVNF